MVQKQIKASPHVSAIHNIGNLTFFVQEQMIDCVNIVERREADEIILQ